MPKSSFLVANGLVHILPAWNSLRKTNSAFWWTKYFCTQLFRINNPKVRPLIRWSHNWPLPNKCCQEPGGGLGRDWEGGKLKVSWAVTTQAGASLMNLMLFLHPKYEFKRLVFYDDRFIILKKRYLDLNETFQYFWNPWQ